MKASETRPPRLPAPLAQRYRVESVLGAGGCGVVVRAHDVHLDRPVAIKIGHPSIRDAHRQRFVREGQVLARLEHPSVVSVYDLGFYEGHGPVLVMQHVDGRSLEEEAPEDALSVMIQVADALDAVHAAGLLHRDVKPANILLHPDGRPVLIDFGLVLDPDLTPLTATGNLVGSLAYMAPELLTGAPPTPASDWYAWGTTLFFLLEGRLPYTGEQLMAFTATGELPPVRFEALPSDSVVAAVLRDVLSPVPSRRPTSGAALRTRLAEELGPSAGGAPRPPSRPWTWLGAFVILALATAWWSRPVTPTSPPRPPSPTPLRDEPALALAESCRSWLEGRGHPALPYPTQDFAGRLQAVADRVTTGVDDEDEERFWRLLDAWMSSRDATHPVKSALASDLARVLVARQVDLRLVRLLDSFGATARGPLSIFHPGGTVARDLADVAVAPDLLHDREQEIRLARIARSRELSPTQATARVVGDLVESTVLVWDRGPRAQEVWARARRDPAPLPPELAWLSYLTRVMALESHLTATDTGAGDCPLLDREIRWVRETRVPASLPADLADLVAATRAFAPIRHAHSCQQVPLAPASVHAYAEELERLPPGWRALVATQVLLLWTAPQTRASREAWAEAWPGRSSIVERIREAADP